VKEKGDTKEKKIFVHVAPCKYIHYEKEKEK
jgi:hypothetical protein